MLGNSPKHGLNMHEDVWDFPQKLGSIAGTIPLGARPFLLMDTQTMSDGTVTVEETKISGMTDHVLTKNSHTSMIYSAIFQIRSIISSSILTSDKPRELIKSYLNKQNQNKRQLPIMQIYL